MTAIDDLDVFATPAVLDLAGVGEVAVPAVDVAALLAASVSANTARNYRQDWTRFTAWCTQHGYVALPAAPGDRRRLPAGPGQVRTETGERRYAIATLTRWVAAIGFVHRAHAAIDQAAAGGGGGEGSAAAAVGEPGRSELVRATLAALRRDYTRHRDRPTRRVAPLLLDDIARILTAGRASAGHLDRAGRRAPRLRPAAARVRRRVPPQRARRAARSATSQHKPGVGLHIRVASSKTDQDGHGHTKALTHGTVAPHLPAVCLPALARRPRRLPPPRTPRAHPPARRPGEWDRHVCRTAGPRLDPGCRCSAPSAATATSATAITGAAIR